MLEFLVKIFLIATTFTSSILFGTSHNQSNSKIVRGVAEMAEEKSASATAEILSPTPNPSSPDFIGVQSGQALTVKLKLSPTSTPSLTPGPKQTFTPTPTNTLTPTPTATKAPTPTPTPTKIPTPTPTMTPFPTPIKSGQVPTISKQNTSANGLDANKLFGMINDYRKSNGLVLFKKDEATCAIAENRAPQVYDEIFGSSVMHSGLKAMKLPYWVNENIINFTTEEDAFDWWISDRIHRDTILGDYEYSCIACSGYSCSEIFTSYVPR